MYILIISTLCHDIHNTLHYTIHDVPEGVLGVQIDRGLEPRVYIQSYRRRTLLGLRLSLLARGCLPFLPLDRLRAESEPDPEEPESESEPVLESEAELESDSESLSDELEPELEDDLKEESQYGAVHKSYSVLRTCCASSCHPRNPSPSPSPSPPKYGSLSRAYRTKSIS